MRIFIFLLATGLSLQIHAQTISPVNIRQGMFIGAGMHASVSATQEKTSIAGLSTQIGFVKKKLGVSLAPQFNFIQFYNADNNLRSGMDFSVVLLGHYRPRSNVSIGLGPVMQITQNVTNQGEWRTVKDFSVMGGIGRNWPLGPFYFALSGIMSYNPSSEDLSLGANIGLNYPF